MRRNLYLEPAKMLPKRIEGEWVKSRIQELVCEEFGTTRSKLFMNTRKRNVLDPYYAAFKLMDDLTSIDYRELMKLAGRDRSSYYNTKKSSQNLFETDREFREKVLRIRQRIINEEIKQQCSTETSIQRQEAL